MSELAIKCIKSWEKFCPNYEIKEWNENNFDLECCEYVKEAYKEKKWAFVSDFARFWILYQEGGIYFDTDVELIRPIDSIVEKGSFFGIERKATGKLLVNPGLGMASEAFCPIYKEIIDFYGGIHFLNDSGTYNLTTVVKYVTDIMKRHGLPDKNLESKGELVENIYIYPWDYFCPISYETGCMTITENTFSIHHFSGSWKTTEELRIKRIEQKVKRVFNNKLGSFIVKILAIPFRIVGQLKAYKNKKYLL